MTYLRGLPLCWSALFVYDRYFHKMLWLNRYGIIPVDCVVVHKNGITVDNRLSNFELAQIDPVLRVPNLPQISPEEEERRARSGDIYRTL